MLELLYNLKERLHFCSLASVSLIGQDFKLKKAIDEFESVAKSSKVLERIYNSAKTLFEGESDNKSCELLDLLALINAVIITQTTTGVEGEIDSTQIKMNEELAGINTKIIPMSHKMLQTFYNSVYKTGAGRIDALDTCLTNTELVFDYRILNGLLHALTDKSADVRKVAVKKLSYYDESLVPLLRKKSDELFAKKPNNAMYYIEIMSNVTDCDEYLLELIDKTKKSEIKFELELLLSEKEENVNIFIESIKNENDIYRSERTVNKLQKMSIKNNKNYFNSYPIEETFTTPQKEHQPGMLIYSNTDPKITDLILSELKNYDLKNLPKDSHKDLLNIDRRNIILLHSCVNSVTDSWFEIMLTYFKGEKLLANFVQKYRTHYAYPEDSQFILLQIICEYIISNNQNLNQAFLDECYSLCDVKSKVMFDFIKDLQTLPSGELFEKYSPYLDDNNDDLTVKCILYVCGLVNLNKEDNNSYIRGLLYADKHGYRRHVVEFFNEKIKLFENLDVRWYEILSNSLNLCNPKMYTSYDSEDKLLVSICDFSGFTIPINENAKFTFISLKNQDIIEKLRNQIK